MPQIPNGGIGGIGQPTEIIKELEKQTRETKVPTKNFADVMAQNAVTESAATNETQSPTKINTDALYGPQKVSQKNDVPGPLKSIIKTLSGDQNSMNKIMNVAMSGQNFSPQQLISLQSAAFKVTFEMDAMSKFAETVSGAVKTTMQTQV